MIEVRIRHADEAKSRRIGEVPFTSAGIDSVIPLLEEWGVYANYTEHGRGDMVGQFVATDEGAFFEVIIGGGE